jgi:hypothetical protein
MTDTNHQINLALRTAAGHARAAQDAEAAAVKTYEMKMKSAGAAAWEAWGLAVRAQPEFQGRKIDDKALVRLYESNRPRPWWDRYLSAVKVEGKPASRDWAKRTLQWHTDPDAARARHATGLLQQAVAQKKLREQRPSAKPGHDFTPRPHRPHENYGPTTAEMRKVAAAASAAPAAYGGAGASHPAAAFTDKAAVLLLLERAVRAVRAMKGAEQIAEAEALASNLVESLEAL